MLVTDTTERAGLGRWIGIPYADHGRAATTGVDCWGLVMLWQRLEMGREVPDYGETYGSSDDMEAVANSVIENSVGPGWAPVELAAAAKGDIVVLRLAGHPCHCGVVLSRGYMLHTLRGQESSIERYDSRIFVKRVQGVFRWVGN